MSSDVSAANAASNMDPSTYYSSVYAQMEEQSAEDQGNVQNQAIDKQQKQNQEDDEYTLWV